MKSRELIKQLLEVDPTGEVEVCVGNHDVFSVHCEPAYWDGRLQLLGRDHSKDPYYNVVGAKYTAKGSKIVITSMGVTDAIIDNADMPVDYSECGNEDTAKRYRETDDRTRAEIRDIELKCDMDSFYQWVKKKVEQIRPGEECRSEADHFYRANLSPKDPVKRLPPKHEGGWEMWPSKYECQEATWDENIEVYWGLGVGIRKKFEGQKTEV